VARSAGATDRGDERATVGPRTWPLGFTLVALLDAFVVIGALDLGAPGWLVGLVAIAVAAMGHAWITRLKRRLMP
jgi:hypothetical protein